MKESTGWFQIVIITVSTVKWGDMTVSNPVGGGGWLKMGGQGGFPWGDIWGEAWVKWRCELQPPLEQSGLGKVKGRWRPMCPETGMRLLYQTEEKKASVAGEQWTWGRARGDKVREVRSCWITQGLVCCGEEFGLILNATGRQMRDVIKGVRCVTNRCGCLLRMCYRRAKGGAKRRAQRRWHQPRG